MKAKTLALVLFNSLLFSCSQAVVEPDAIHIAAGLTKGARVENPPCSPISSLSIKGDSRVGGTSTGSIDLSYSVKPCDKTQTVRVLVQIIEYSTGNVISQNENAPLSGQYHYEAVGLLGYYTGRVTVFDALTGAVLATQYATVNLAPKIGV